MSGFDDDDIGKDIAAAIDQANGSSPSAPAGGEPALPSEPKPDKTEARVSEGERARDATGKFVASTEKPAAQDKKSVAPAETATGAQAQAPVTATPTEQPLAPPAHWRGAGKVEWNTLPKNIQQAINEDYTNFSKPAGELQQLKAAIGEDRLMQLQADYGSIPQAFQSLATIREMANNNPVGFLHWFAQQRGIDLRQLVQGQPGLEQQPGQDSNPLLQKIASLESQISQFFQQQQNQVQTQVMSEIDAFSRDPKHPYFNDVREHMGALMKAGKAADLQEAYDMATWAHPDVRKSLLSEQTQQAMQANAQKVQAARQAAGSITGSPAGAVVAADEPKRNLDEDIAHAVSKALGG